MERFKLLGIHIDSVSEDEVYHKIFELTDMDKPTQVVLLDTYLLMKAKFNKELFNIINNADLVLPVSPGIKFGLNFFHKKVAKVYNFFNFSIRLLTQITEETKKNVYVLGGNKKASEKSEKNIRESFPGIRLMGRHRVDYRKDFEPKLLTAMQKVSPSFVLVSMRRPKQEKWIYSRKKNFNNCVFIGVENFINILGGKELSPTDKHIESGGYSFKMLLKRPFSSFYYVIFFILLLVYKIFKLN